MLSHYKISLLTSLATILLTLAGCSSNSTPRTISRNNTPALDNSLLSMQQQAGADAQNNPPGINDVFASNAQVLNDQSSLTTTPPPQSHPLQANSDQLRQVLDTSDPAHDSPNTLAATPQREIHSPSTLTSPHTTSRTIEQTPQQRRAQLIEELASILRQESRISPTPAEPLTQLAALELLEPGLLPDSTLESSALTQREREISIAWRDLLRSVAQGTRSGAGDISHIPSSINTAAKTLGTGTPLSITHASLCSKVEGFGRYAELPRKILAGRSHAAIVYIELDNFASRPGTDAKGNAAHIVEISQELSLYHDADGLLAWKQPQQLVTDTSRSERHDFFLVQRIDLPQTLTVGIYRLKITVHDKVSGYSAEVILPLEVVADANLIRTFK